MPETTPSSGAGATPGAGTPATGTPASGATPPAAALTLEEALKKIADLEQHASNKTEEASRHGSKLTAAEKELAAYKEKERLAAEAQLTETQKLQKQYADLEAERDALSQEVIEARVLQDVAKYGPKLKFTLDDPGLLSKLLDWEAVEFDDKGKPTNVEKLLETLAKNSPRLIDGSGQQQQQQGQQSQRGGAPAVPPFNVSGRATIQPGQSIPGRIPRLGDLDWKR